MVVLVYCCSLYFTTFSILHILYVIKVSTKCNVIKPLWKKYQATPLTDTCSSVYNAHLLSALSQQDNAHGEEGDVGPLPPIPDPMPSSALECLLGEAYRPREEEGAQKSRAEEAEDEVRRYRSRRPAGLQENPLAWWKENKKEYPLLARLARRYLCVPGTSVASERVFSTAGDIITAKRSCLTPGHVNELLFLQKNLSIPK